MMQDKNKAVSRIAAVAPLPKIREILVVEGGMTRRQSKKC